MQIIKKKDELKKTAAACKSQEKTLGLVCAAGALTDAYQALIRKAVSENDVAIVSLFASPKGDAPRNLMDDAEILAQLDADILFAPKAEEMYSTEELADSNELDFGEEEHAVGGKQTSSFVGQLFAAAEPTRAYFLEDDRQLAAYRLIEEKDGPQIITKQAQE